MRRGAIILAGGESRRMGRPKAWLPIAGEALLQRIDRILSSVTEVRIVVAARSQSLPALPKDVIIAHDDRPGMGPLEGLQAGLRTGCEMTDAELFYVSGCDAPLLDASFVMRLFQLARSTTDIVVPRDETHFHPLAAVYHTRVLPLVQALLSADRRRPFFLFEEANTRIVPTSELQDVDPRLLSLMNLNTPDDYQRALRILES